jgi:coproporphyrinogen III oxidase-like Fe-S oxidoreductase
LEALNRHELPTAGRERLTTEQELMETVSLGLRSDGIRLRRFRDLFNFDFLALNRTRLSEFVAAGFIEIDEETVRCTPKGYLSCDALTLELLNDR